MRRKIVRSIWGIQPKSFHAATTYINQKHMQIVKKIQHLIEFFQSSSPDTTHELLQHKEIMKTLYQLDHSLENYLNQINFQWKKRLFGFKKQNVMDYIQDLKRLQEYEVLNLKNALEVQLNEREKLFAKLPKASGGKVEISELASTNEITKAKGIAEELKSILEEEIKAGLFQEVKEIVKQDLALDTELALIHDLKENLKRNLIQEQQQYMKQIQQIQPIQPVQIKELREPIHQENQKDSQQQEPQQKKHQLQQQMKPIVQQPYKPLISKRSNFWGEDLEEFIDQPYHCALSPQESNINEVTSGSEEESMNTDLRREQKASSAVEDQTYELKKKYIVGKISGTNIIDQNGALIVKKHSIITEEILKTAEQAGKLADLIVNMVTKRIGD